jgi:hypothetical protein
LDAQCGANRSPAALNALCGACLSGYSEWRGDCVPCSGTDAGLLSGVLLLSWLYVVFIHVSAASNDGALPILMYFLQTCLQIAGTPTSWVQWLNVAFFAPQNIDLAGSSNGAHNDTAQATGTSDASGSISSRCIVPLSPMQELLLPIGVSFVFFALHALTALLHSLVALVLARSVLARTASHASDNDPAAGSQSRAQRDSGVAAALARLLLPWRFSSYQRSFVSLLFFAYAQISTAVFNYLQCVQLQGSFGRVVQSVPAVSCDSDEYKSWLVGILALLVVYVIGLPLSLETRLD